MADSPGELADPDIGGTAALGHVCSGNRGRPHPAGPDGERIADLEHFSHLDRRERLTRTRPEGVALR
jgi:hypothetical protein